MPDSYAKGNVVRTLSSEHAHADTHRAGNKCTKCPELHTKQEKYITNKLCRHKNWQK